MISTILAIILGCAFVLAGIVAWRMSRSIAWRFSFEDLLLGPDDRASLSKIGQATALIVSTWGFVFLTMAGKMTEWYFGVYMAAWAGAGLMNKWINQQEAKP